jgi:hypothetical protein
MKIVFCAEPFAPTTPDSAYAREVEAMRAVALEHVLIDFEALVHDRNVVAAIRRVKVQESEQLAIYRGWMLRPALYAELYGALHERGLKLINDPHAYSSCHYLPPSYSLIAPYTPKTVWTAVGPEFTPDDVLPLLAPFGDTPLIIKDYVKSRKHEWLEACFIPSAIDHANVLRVVNRFLELQGGDLNEGLVFREFVPLQPLATHSRSGMPLTQEFRLWFVNGQRVYCSHYWEEGKYTSQAPDENLFSEVARAIPNRFFTMDVAQRLDGTWIIVELGDGQVAGLPETADVDEFYRVVYEALQS